MSDLSVIVSSYRVSFTPEGSGGESVLLDVGALVEAEPTMEGGPQVVVHEHIAREWAEVRSRGNAQYLLRLDAYELHESPAAAQAFGWNRWLELTMKPAGVLRFMTGFEVGAEGSGAVDWEFDAVVQQVVHEPMCGETSPFDTACGTHMRYEVLLTRQRQTGEADEWVQRPQGTEEDNFNSYGFGMQVLKSGTVVGLDVECRNGGTAVPAGVPLWTKVWDANGNLLAVSENSQVHAVGALLSWEFSGFAVEELSSLRVTMHADNDMQAEFAAGRMCCFRVVRKVEGEAGGMLNSAGGYSNTTHVAKYVLRMVK